MLDEVRKMIDQLGFPSGVLVAAFWWLKYREDAHEKERARLLGIIEKLVFGKK